MPMKFRKEPSQLELMEWLAYDPATGVFIWIKDPSPHTPGRFVGRRAGCSTGAGYWIIGVRSYGQLLAHRLAWIYVNVSIPNGMEIDHADRNPANNAIENLRLATSSQQKRIKRVQSNSASGLKGAFIHRPRAARGCSKIWRSQIKVENKLHCLGWFETAEDAHAAYRKAAAKYFGEFDGLRP